MIDRTDPVTSTGPDIVAELDLDGSATRSTGEVDIDADLIARARTGDGAAFAELVGRHRTRAWSVCLRITGDRGDAEDALQDALTAAWQNLDRFRGDARFSTWLHRICANAAVAVVRRRRELLQDFSAFDRESDAPPTADRIADIDAVRAALMQLPNDFRVAIVLREFGDLSYAEIAAHQGIAVQTVKSRINRGRTQLLQALSRS